MTETAAPRSRLRARLLRVAVGLASASLPLLAFEALVALSLRSPSFAAQLPRPLLTEARQAYLRGRKTIQFEPGCARFDPELLYTLKPGRFVFANAEFSTTFDVNRLGVRDSEEALDGPELLVTGDSFAMGWGVERAETFGALLGAATGLRTLNAAVSSYGTVREMLLLNRVDSRRAKYLVVQYCRNDWEENARFARDGNRHRPGSTEARERARYAEAVESVHAGARYWPGRYAASALSAYLRSQERPATPEPRDEALAFLNALDGASRGGVERLRTIVLDPTNPTTVEGEPDAFVRALEACLREPERAARARSLRVLDVSRVLTPEDYYVLDDHLRPSGHAKVARALAELLGTW